MQAGFLRIELLVIGARSLKEKRRPLKSLIGKLQNRFNVSAAEVDYQDKHQRSTIGVALVASDGDSLRRQIGSVCEFVRANPDMQVLDISERLVKGPDAGETPLSSDFEL